ncbi:MAG: hypothetical protein J0L99_17410 [Chitinophagales bacterium]|nr:hypothetical protein [Chitinophagales bacterium]
MSNQKVNIFISYDPADKAVLDNLVKWMYPLQDEVNIWYYNPPPKAEALSLPWQLLLFWYKAPNNTHHYHQVYNLQKQHAHIYVFLTSHHALVNKSIEADITLAVTRQNSDEFHQMRLRDTQDAGDWRTIQIFPVVTAPSLWQKQSRLARFKTIGPAKSIKETTPVEDAYMKIVEDLDKAVKKIAANLAETAQAVKFTQERPGESFKGALPEIRPPEAPTPLPDPSKLVYKPVQYFSPPEWFGWAIIFVIFFSALQGLLPDRRSGRFNRSSIRTDSTYTNPQFELDREPIAPPDDGKTPLPLPGPDDSIPPIKPLKY